MNFLIDFLVAVPIQNGVLSPFGTAGLAGLGLGRNF